MAMPLGSRGRRTPPEPRRGTRQNGPARPVPADGRSAVAEEPKRWLTRYLTHRWVCWRWLRYRKDGSLGT